MIKQTSLDLVGIEAPALEAGNKTGGLMRRIVRSKVGAFIAGRLARPFRHRSATAHGLEAVRAEAIRTERVRIRAILNLHEAQGNEQLAQAIALESDLTPEEAGRLLDSHRAAGKRRS